MNEFYKKPEETIEEYYERTPTPDKPGTITTDDLTPTTPVDYENYVDKPVDVSGITIADLTPEEQKQQTATEELQGLLGQLGGESAYRTQIGTDIAGLEKTKTEQGIIVQNLQLEAQRLANEYAGMQDVMQQRATGRGITAGGLAPLTAGEQRKIAIQQRGIASQALTAYAAYQTASDNLQVAQDAIDRAVKAKFDPIKEEIDIKKQNLELLLASPLATAQQKAQAEAQLKKQEAETKKIDEQQGFYESIQGLYVQAAATPNINPTTINSIKKILNKPELSVDDVAEVTRLTTEAGVGVKTKIPATKTVGGNLYQYNPDTGKWDLAVGGGGDDKDKPMSVNQIEQFRRSYGWTPPYGFTENQLLQYINDNPNFTPEELEAGARQAQETTTQETTTTPEEMITSIMDTITDVQLKTLKTKAGEVGISSMWKSKRTDVKNYLNSIKDTIQLALDRGYTLEEIVAKLTE